MLIWGRSLLRWGRRTTMTIMAVGSGRGHRAGRGRGDQVDQPRRRRVRPAAETAAPNGAAPTAPSPDQLPQQHPAPAMVRAWARTQGLPVADRGPLPSWVLDQYLAQESRPASTGRTTGRTTPARRPPPSTSSAA